MQEKNYQNINLIRSKRQIKLDFKEVKSQKTISTNQTSFVLYDDIMPKDVLFKLNSWQEKRVPTYISSLLTSTQQMIIRVEDSLEYEKSNEFKVVKLDSEYNLVVDKNVIFEEKHFYEKSGIDFIFSTFHTLINYLEQNPLKNSLVTLAIDEKLFTVVTDLDAKIVYSCINSISSFEEVHNSKFYDNEILGQKLFDEVYCLELQDVLNEVITEFYQEHNEAFLENIKILYSIKQLSEEQVGLLEDELMMRVSYEKIDIFSHMNSILDSMEYLQKSFTTPRKKSSKKSFFFWLIAMIVSIIVVVAVVLYLKFGSEGVENLFKEEKTSPQESSKVSSITLPNHIENNSDVKQKVQALFNTIPERVLLKDIFITKQDSMLIADFLSEDTYQKSMNSKFLEIYESSEIKYRETGEEYISEGIITNKDYRKPADGNSSKSVTYFTTPISKDKFKQYLKSIVGEGAIIGFVDSQSDEKTVTYSYNINTIIDSPKEFFDFIESLEREEYSINITYPIRLSKNIEGIELIFSVDLVQFTNPLLK